MFISFVALHDMIHPRATTEFVYRYHNPERAQIFLSFQLQSANRAQEVSELIASLQTHGMKAVDISDDEMAKTHARYMIGGCTQVPNERLFRFGTFDYSHMLDHRASLDSFCVSRVSRKAGRPEKVP